MSIPVQSIAVRQLERQSSKNVEIGIILVLLVIVTAYESLSSCSDKVISLLLLAVTKWYLIWIMRSKLTLEQLNALTPNEFHKVFENVVECWPEAAIFCSAMLPFKSFDAMITTFENYLQRLSDENKLRILRLHPDLAGKLLDTHQLTEESSFEQACAGLDKLTAEDKDRLTTLNDEYKTKFGFPFVICVREASKFDAILKGVTERINNSPAQELEIGIGEVKKICRLRILELVNKL